MSSRLLLRLTLSLLAPFALMGMECEPEAGGMLPPEGPIEEPRPSAEDPEEPHDGPGHPEDPEHPEGELPEEPSPEDHPPAVPVEDLAITGVSLYQAVEIPLGTDEGSFAPVIANKGALLRAFVEPLEGFMPRMVVAEWTVEDGEEVRVIEVEVRVNGASDPMELDSTLNIELEADLVTPSTRVSLELVEPPPGPEETGERRSDGAIWPSDGDSVSLGAVDIGDGITVRLVPLQYAADGSDRLPDTTADWVDTLRGAVMGLTPAPDAVVWVDAPMTLREPLAASGSGWSDALVQLTDLREVRNVRDDEYVYGLVNPADTYGEYCGSSCVAGLSWRATDPSQAFARTSMGIGYVGASAQDTFIHELGHAHGRQHTPCGGPANPDPAYPYEGGLIGQTGWDAGAGELIDIDHGDLMGYCRPRWVSDYTYGAFADRMAYLHAAPYVVSAPGWPKDVYVVELPLKRQPRVVGELTLRQPPTGELRVLEVLNGSGDVLYATEVASQIFEHTGDEILFVPVPASRQAVELRVDGSTIPLPR